jgi:hypothetical protein
VSQDGRPRGSASAERKPDGTRTEWLVVLLVVAMLMPAVAEYAGGGIDDWWDLAYVRALADRASIDFAEPMLGTEVVHPRFSWSSWLLLQATVRAIVGVDPALLNRNPRAARMRGVGNGGRDARPRVFGAAAPVPVVLAVLTVPAWA